MIQPVITCVPRIQEQVRRLVAHCLKLDGTVVRVVHVNDEGHTPLFKGTEAEYRASFSLRTAAISMDGQPFIWMEPDSIPTRPGWAQILSDEYARCGKPFMLSSDSTPPDDIVGGIGVYPTDTKFLIPVDFKHDAWDKWMLHHLSGLIHRTPLIQHRYGFYENGLVKHRPVFPRDNDILRPEAVIFHSDKHQSLIPGFQASFFHTGDLGDIIAAMPVARQLGGGKFIVGPPVTGPCARQPRESLAGGRFEAIRPLLESQEYISSVDWAADRGNPTFDFSQFRIDYRDGENLACWQARHLGCASLDFSPWIKVAPSSESSGRVVIARSHRYQNPNFDWKGRLGTHGKKALFVGLPSEHRDFESKFGHVEYHPTENLLKLAEIIAGSELFIGNQSSPAWIAMGLGHKLEMEVCPWVQNSIVQRDNAVFTV